MSSHGGVGRGSDVTNVSTNLSALTECHPVMDFYWTVMLFVVIFLIGLIGNSLVLYALWRYKQLRTTTNILVGSLAVSDLCFIVVVVPLTANLYWFQHWMLGNALCRIYQYASFMFVNASAYNLVLMSLDRFLAVVYPIDSMRMRNQRNTLIAVFLVWIVAIVAFLYLIPLSSVKGIPGADATCQYTSCSVDPDVLFQFHIPFNFVMCFCIPFVTISILYSILLFRLIFPRKTTINSNSSNKPRRRATRMVIVLVITFGVCALPLEMYFLYQKFALEQSSGTISLLIFSQFLIYANSSINPILYAFLSKNFREAYRNLLTCSWLRSQHQLDNNAVATARVPADANTSPPTKLIECKRPLYLETQIDGP